MRVTHPIPRVLFFTDNGMGLGHLTRVLAIARRSKGRFQPIVLTLSLAYWLLDDWDVPAEHFPSYGHLGVTKRQWTAPLTDRLVEAVRWTGAGAIVVDHVSPPSFERLRQALPEIEVIWLRRGLWKPGKNRDALATGPSFTTIVEPGDLAAPVDQGPTTYDRTEVIRVPPLTLVSPDEYLAREEARSVLGLPTEGRAILLQLGEIDTASLKERIIEAREAVLRVVHPENVHFFAPLHPLHPELDDIPGVICRPVYPIGRYFRAFDAAISNAGYNSYHELVSSGLPVVFIARETRIDDQTRRALFAQWAGRAYVAPSTTGTEFEAALSQALRPHEPAIAQATTDQLIPMTGADEVAALLSRLASPGTPTSTIPRYSRATEDVPVSRHELPSLLRDLEGSRLVIDARQADYSTVAKAIPAIRDHPTVIPLIRGGHPSLTDLAVPYESVMSARQWEQLGSPVPYEQYTHARLASMVARYSAEMVLTLA